MIPHDLLHLQCTHMTNLQLVRCTETQSNITTWANMCVERRFCISERFYTKLLFSVHCKWRLCQSNEVWTETLTGSKLWTMLMWTRFVRYNKAVFSFYWLKPWLCKSKYYKFTNKSIIGILHINLLTLQQFSAIRL